MKASGRQSAGFVAELRGRARFGTSLKKLFTGPMQEASTTGCCSLAAAVPLSTEWKTM